ncbi:hypothetical protein EKH55_2857 [Sinorhizobium alkalisoli]|nr:hypothetical protein EKH55_2857 [Sinorhizobium alkalisoli]
MHDVACSFRRVPRLIACCCVRAAMDKVRAKVNRLRRGPSENEDTQAAAIRPLAVLKLSERVRRLSLQESTGIPCNPYDERGAEREGYPE